MIVASANVFAWILARERIPQEITAAVVRMELSPILLLMHQMYQSPASIEAAASIPLASLDDACAYSGSGNGTMSGQPCISP